MSRDGRALVLTTDPKSRAIARPIHRLTRRQIGDALSRFEAAETYRRACAIERGRTALVIDRLA